MTCQALKSACRRARPSGLRRRPRTATHAAPLSTAFELRRCTSASVPRRLAAPACSRSYYLPLLPACSLARPRHSPPSVGPAYTYKRLPAARTALAPAPRFMPFHPISHLHCCLGRVARAPAPRPPLGPATPRRPKSTARRGAVPPSHWRHLPWALASRPAPAPPGCSHPPRIAPGKTGPRLRRHPPMLPRPQAGSPSCAAPLPVSASFMAGV